MEEYDLVSSVRYLMDGELTPAEWIRSFRGVQEITCFAQDDLLPMLAIFLQGFRELFGRLWLSAKRPSMPAQSQKAVNAHFSSTLTRWRDLYDRDDLYSLLYQQRGEIVLSLVDKLRLPRGARVLDIGCGPGLISRALAERGYVVHAIDRLPAMIDMARQAADKPDVGQHILTTVCDVRQLSFADNTFDLVVMVGVTEWLESLGKPISEISRVLRPDRSAIVTGDNAWSLHFLLDPLLNPVLSIPVRLVIGVCRRLGLWRPSSGYRLRSNRELESSIRAAGLEVVRRRNFGFGPFSFLLKTVFADSLGWKIHNWLQSLADKRWPILHSTGHVYIAVVRKRP